MSIDEHNGQSVRQHPKIRLRRPCWCDEHTGRPQLEDRAEVPRFAPGVAVGAGDHDREIVLVGSLFHAVRHVGEERI